MCIDRMLYLPWLDVCSVYVCGFGCAVCTGLDAGGCSKRCLLGMGVGFLFCVQQLASVMLLW